MKRGKFRALVGSLSACLSAIAFAMPPVEPASSEVSNLAHGVFVKEIAQLYAFAPESIRHAREIPGFSKPEQLLYEVRFLDRQKGLHVLLWINTEDRLAFVACRPGEYLRGACAYYKGKNGKQTQDVAGRIIKLDGK